MQEVILLNAKFPATYKKYKFEVTEIEKEDDRVKEYSWKVFGINGRKENFLPEVVNFMPSYMCIWNGNTPKKAASFIAKNLYILEMKLETINIEEINKIIVDKLRKVIERVDADIAEKELVWFEDWHYNRNNIALGKTMRIVYCPNKLHKHKLVISFY